MFKTGKYYKHEYGRMVWVRAAVDTTLWGRVYMIEHAGEGSPGVGVMHESAVKRSDWREIQLKEWEEAFADLF